MKECKSNLYTTMKICRLHKHENLFMVNIYLVEKRLVEFKK
jgi:hypothetical protein